MSTTIEKKFPDCFPDNFQEDILPQALPPAKIPVYRLCLEGTLNRKAFLSTYELVHLGLRPKDEDWERRLSDPGTYSTSCYKKKSDIVNNLKIMRRQHPPAIVAFGVSTSDYGPLQETKYRTGTKSSHVDWWLYKNVDPSSDFEEIEVVL